MKWCEYNGINRRASERESPHEGIRLRERGKTQRYKLKD